MVPEPTRRRVLAGGAALAGGTALGGVIAPVGYLPDRIVEWRTNAVDTPGELPPPAEPTDDHVAAAREDARDTIDRAEAAWAAVTEADRERFDREHPDAHLTYDEGGVESAREYLDDGWGSESNTRALRDARFAISRAGSALGAARVVTGETDDEALRAASRDLLADVDAFVRDLTYEMADPDVGVGVLSHVEDQLESARLNAFGGFYATGHSESKRTYRPREAAEMVAGRETARRRLDDARRFLAALREGQDGGTDRFETLDRKRRAARDVVETEYPSQMAAHDAIGEGDDLRTTIRWHFYTLGPMDWHVRSPETTLRDGLHALAATEQATALLRARAWDYARGHSTVEAGDERIDPAVVYRTKRRLADRFGALVDRYRGDPTARTLLADVRRTVESANIGYPERDLDYPYAEGYAWYRFALGQCVHFEDVLGSALPRTGGENG